jgi:hypothetical protein
MSISTQCKFLRALASMRQHAPMRVQRRMRSSSRNLDGVENQGRRPALWARSLEGKSERSFDRCLNGRLAYNRRKAAFTCTRQKRLWTCSHRARFGKHGTAGAHNRNGDAANAALACGSVLQGTPVFALSAAASRQLCFSICANSRSGQQEAGYAQQQERTDAVLADIVHFADRIGAATDLRRCGAIYA